MIEPQYTYARATLPEVDEIIIVPLANPSGAYIRIDDNEKIPILAKVRSVFSNTINVINIFGYIYNVPISHTELFNFELSDKYYMDMINNARNILQKIGYPILDNQEFYKTQPKYTTYIVSYLPNYQTYLPDGSGSSFKNLSQKNPNSLDKDRTMKYVLGKIKVIAMGTDSLLHYVDKTTTEVLYDPDTGELLIQGYGLFVADSSYTYTKDQTQYIVFRSHRNYFHIKLKRVKKVASNTDSYTIPLKLTKTEYGYYEVQTLKPKQHKPKHQKYFDIITKIKKESF